MDEYFTVDEVAALLKVTRATVYNWMRDGDLTYVTVGDRRRVPRTALAAFIKPGQPAEQLQPVEASHVDK